MICFMWGMSQCTMYSRLLRWPSILRGSFFSRKFKPRTHEISIGIFLHWKKKSSRKKDILQILLFAWYTHGYNIDEEIIRSHCLDTIVGVTPNIEFIPWKIALTNNSQLSLKNEGCRDPRPKHWKKYCTTANEWFVSQKNSPIN